MIPTIFEYVPLLQKQAEEAEDDSIRKLLQVAGGSALGGGVGFLAGRLIGHGVNKLHGGPLPTTILSPMGSALGGALGLAYSLHKLREMKELQSVNESKPNTGPGGIPGQ